MYCRKSSEDNKERQMQSIESQEKELKRLAEDQGFHVVKIFREERSAHTRGRAIFGTMMAGLERGEANAILTWHANRLARNPFDGGWVITAMDEGVIKEVKTMAKTYYNESDDKFFLQLEFGIAKKDSDDKSKVVKRGLATKCERGSMPGVAPAGYLNTPELAGGSRYIKKDLERFDLIKKAWELMAMGTYSVRRIQKMMNDDWGYKSRPSKRQGNRPMSMSTLYKIFNDGFYYGYFEYPRGSGSLYKGSHEPMIDEETFNRVQFLLGNKLKAKPRKDKMFTYGGGIIKCGECSSQITIEDKYKKQKNGTIHHYIIYRCTKSKNRNCTQHAIQEHILSEQVASILEKIEIPADFHEFAMQWLKTENAKESEDRNLIWATQERAYNLCLKKLDGLIDMRATGELTEEEYSAKKSEALKDKERLEAGMQNIGKRVEHWLELAEDVFKFAENAKKKFDTTKDLQVKRQILSVLGSNFILKDKKLSISLDNVLFPLQIISQDLKSNNSTFEPLSNGVNKRQTEDFSSVCPTLLRQSQEVRTCIEVVEKVWRYYLDEEN